MAGLGPAIHVFLANPSQANVDAGDKRGHDAESVFRPDRNSV
jgi:hypothetical protein